MLIALQKPNASHVAGFHTWNQLGRYVKKGGKGIFILAPVLRRKNKQDQETKESSPAIAGFRAACVFDISQTDGKELPRIGTVHGDPMDYAARLQAFAKIAGNRSRVCGRNRSSPRNLVRRESPALAGPNARGRVFDLDA